MMRTRRTAMRVTTMLALACFTACGGVEVEPTPDPPPPPPVEEPTDEPVEAPVEARLAVSPQSGESGASVTLDARGLAPGAMVTLGFGPPESEYQILDSRAADADGSLRTTVRVPDWAEAGRDYVFVADGPTSLAVAEFTVTAPAAPPADRPTDPAENVEVTGMLTDEGVECPALRSDGGELYTLAGDTGDFTVGDRVTVEGTIAEVSGCMQGTTIRVESIRPGSGTG